MDRANCTQRLKVVELAPPTGAAPGRRRKGDAASPAARAAALAEVRRPVDEGGLGLSDKVPPLAAERPDAAPRRWDTLLRAAAHAVVLTSVVGFVLVYCVWSPLSSRLRGASESAIVAIVADAPAEVRAPEIIGVFIAVRPLPNGAAVRKGQLLGRIESPRLVAEIERAAAELNRLRVQQLRVEERGRFSGVGMTTVEDAESLAGRVAAAEDALERLHGLRRRLLVHAPVDGSVEQGLAATADVAPGVRLTGIVPGAAGLHLEVTGPIEVLNELQRRGAMAAEFSTPGGPVKVSAVPVRGSVRSFMNAGAGRREEIWGTLRCTPMSVPEAARVPGALGRVCW